MNNNLYIDDLNVLGRFGCRVTRGGYNDLLAFPAMKEPERNDWPEEDGILANARKVKEATLWQRRIRRRQRAKQSSH